MLKLYYLFNWCALVSIVSSARILAVFPVPFHSHQSVFRPLTHELARRGHEVVVITTDPTPNDNLPANLTEIDVHDVSYELLNSYSVKITGTADESYYQIDKFYDIFGKLLEVQIKTVGFQKLINDKNQHFDLVFVEACIRSALVFSHLYKAPAITISSLGTIEYFTNHLGLPEHPILYPSCLYKKLNDLTLWDKAELIYKHYMLAKNKKKREAVEDDMLKRNFGDDVPPLSELKKNVVMLMMNVHHIWEGNRPVPPNVVYLGGLHLETNYSKNLSKEFKSYLDTSTQGVIYVSFGSHVMPSVIKNMKIIIKALSKVPYNVLLKWDDDSLTECPKNIKIIKWVQQRELLHHPNIKLFITQGGTQSTDEAIAAGVPVIGIPLLGDQWYNAEKYVYFKIGLRIDLDNVTEKKMLDAINTVINDNSYKNNIVAFRNVIYDQPLTSLERAVWWTEYMLKHGRSNHLMAPAAHMSSWEFFEMDLLLVTVISLITIIAILGLGGFKLIKRSVNKKCKSQ